MTIRVGVNARQQFLQTTWQEGKDGQSWYQIIFNWEWNWWVTDNSAFSFPLLLLLLYGPVAGVLQSVLSAGRSLVVQDGCWSCLECVPWTAWRFPAAGGNALLAFLSCCSLQCIHLQEPCQPMWMKMCPVSKVMCPWHFFFCLSRETLLAHATHRMRNLHIAVLHWLQMWYVNSMNDRFNCMNIFAEFMSLALPSTTVCRLLSSQVYLLK